jgi:photosystem II stability/assembly factor-like uncharacterized protein
VRAAPEEAIVKACLEYLRLRGVYAYRTNTGAAAYQDRTGKRRFVRFGTPGLSDITGVLPGGRALYVECKAENGRLSEHQEAFLKTVREFGALTVVARSITDLEMALNQCQQQTAKSM